MTSNNPKAPLLPLLHPSSPATFSSLPDEIIVDCLSRIPISYYRYICSTSKRIYALISSPELYEVRSQIGATKPCLYVCMWLPNPTNNHHHRWYTLSSEIDDEDGKKLSLVLSSKLSNSSSYSPKLLDTSSVSVRYEIYQIGGTLKDDTTRSRDVHVLDCRTDTWRRGPSLTVGRKFARCCVLDRKIYVIGGCVKSDKAMNWGEVLDLKNPQTWKPLKSPSVDDDTFFEVAVIRETLYVFFTVSGNNYAYDPKEGGRWILVNDQFKGLEPLSVLSRAWCIIDNFMFAEIGDKYKWYDHHYNRWTEVYGLNDFYSYRCHHYGSDARTVKLVNYGGKLVIMWDNLFDSWRQEKDIWCAVIRIEKRLTISGIIKIWGKFESCNSLVSNVLKSYKLLTCLSTSV